MMVPFSKVSNLYSFNFCIHHQDFPRVWLKWVEPPIKLPSFQTKLVVGGTGILEGAFLVQFLYCIHVHFEDVGPTCEPDPRKRNFEGSIFDSILLLENANLDNFGPRCEPEPKIPNFEENMLSPIPFFNGTSDRLANKL